jgi:phage terminase large subunit-like protein
MACLAVRAEPIAALYAQGKACHVGRFPQLEEQIL